MSRARRCNGARGWRRTLDDSFGSNGRVIDGGLIGQAVTIDAIDLAGDLERLRLNEIGVDARSARRTSGCVAPDSRLAQVLVVPVLSHDGRPRCPVPTGHSGTARNVEDNDRGQHRERESE